MDCSSLSLTIIQLTEDERKRSEEFGDFEDFLLTLEGKYNFCLQDCYWITAESPDVRWYKDGRVVNE